MQIFFLILEDGKFTTNSLKNKTTQNVYSSKISSLILHFLRAITIRFQPAEAKTTLKQNLLGSAVFYMFKKFPSMTFIDFLVYAKVKAVKTKRIQ